MTEPTFKKAKAYAYRLINYRPRSRSELKNRLGEKGYSEQTVNKLIGDLKDEGLIDDRSFAKLWAKMRSQASGRSLSFIRMELISKGVDRDIVCETIDELKEDFNEEEVARQILKKRLRLVGGMDKGKAKARLFGYLKRRGFSTHVIYKLIDEAY